MHHRIKSGQPHFNLNSNSHETERKQHYKRTSRTSNILKKSLPTAISSIKLGPAKFEKKEGQKHGIVMSFKNHEV